MKTEGIFEKEFEVTINDVDSDNLMRVSSFAKLMQETAALHSGIYGYGINDTAKNNMVWIITCWKISIISRPCWNEKIRVRTWIDAMEKLYYYRDFEVVNGAGEVICKAVSQWIMFDIKNRKIEIISDKYNKMFPTVHKIGYDNAIKKPRFIFEDKSPNKSFEYTIMKRDVDTNYHMNNTVYLDIGLEGIEKHKDVDISEIEVHYKTECKYGEKIICDYTIEKERNIVRILSEDRKKTHATLIIK